jgi:hypothetical protein
MTKHPSIEVISESKTQVGPVAVTFTVGRIKRVKKCEECRKYPADLPSRLCPGCDAYREHTGAF